MSAAARGPAGQWSLPCGCIYQPGIVLPIIECKRHGADSDLAHTGARSGGAA